MVATPPPDPSRARRISRRLDRIAVMRRMGIVHRHDVGRDRRSYRIVVIRDDPNSARALDQKARMAEKGDRDRFLRHRPPRGAAAEPRQRPRCTPLAPPTRPATRRLRRDQSLQPDRAAPHPSPPRMRGIRMTRAARDEGLSSHLQHDLDEEWARRGNPFGEAVVERLHCRDPRAGHAHRARETHPVEVGMAEIEHVERLAAGIAGADIGELAAQDRVAAVREEQRRHVEPLARLRPQRLQGVHAAAVALEADHLAVRARHRGAGRHRHAHADRAAHIRQPIMRRRRTGRRKKAAPGRDRLVDDDRILRKQRRRATVPIASELIAPVAGAGGGSLVTGAGVECAPSSSAKAASAPIRSSSGRART